MREPHADSQSRLQRPTDVDAAPLEVTAEFPSTNRPVEETRSFASEKGAGPSFSPLAAGSEFGNYQLMEEIARGGMGIVFKARELGLNRIVALKMILSGQIADDREVKRFRAEAEAAANLDHPGIVPVHECGEVQGQQYYSMGFVAGQSLSARLAHGPLPPREAADMVARIAEAVAYAHEKGVIHRDLKPGNVLLDAAGQPRVSDFGLAKKLGGDAGLTVTGQAMGTPCYMPPEQAAGETDKIGPRSDVYAIGATLYCSLTGRPPFHAASSLETMHQVLHQEVVPPRQLNPHLPRDLETICLKCLEKDPARRYAGALAIAEELGRYLRDEPIRARPLGSVARLWRWCRRKPAVAGLAAAVAVALLAGTFVSLSLAGVASRSARLANDRATEIGKKNAELLQANALADEQSHLALRSLQSVIVDVQQRLHNVPGAWELRRQLLRTALARLNEVSDKYVSRTTIDQNSAVVLRELGDVFLRIGSDSAKGVESEGALAAARDLYQRALNVTTKLAADNPGDPLTQRDLYAAYANCGDVNFQSGRIVEALADYRQGLAVAEKLAANGPYKNLAQRCVSVCYGKIGDSHLQSQGVNEALAAYQKALSLDVELAAASPRDPQAKRDLAVSYQHLGDAQLRLGQVDAAMAAYAAALQIGAKLAADDPGDSQTQRNLSTSHLKAGDVLLQYGLVREALAAYQKRLEICQSLAKVDQANIQARRDLAVSHFKFGDAQIRTGDFEATLKSYLAGRDVLQSLADADPSDPQAQRELSVAHTHLGQVQMQWDKLHDALAAFEQALKIDERLAAANPDNVQARRDLSVTLQNIGDVRLASGRASESLAAYEVVLRHCQELAAADLRDVRAQRDLATAHAKVGDARFASEELSAALAAYQECARIREKLVALDPSDAANQRDLNVTYNRIAGAQFQIGDLRPALATGQKSLEIAQKLTARDPSDVQAQLDLVVTLEVLGRVTRATGNHDTSRRQFESALSVAQRLYEQQVLPPGMIASLARLKQEIDAAQSPVTATLEPLDAP